MCKPGYTGEFCEYCESSPSMYCVVVNNEFRNGSVDSITGQGVECSCKKL